jgi:hypothetical protein
MLRPLAFVCLSVIVGAVLAVTVFRNDIAQATGLAQSVTVDNTPDQSVPVRGVGRTILVADNLVVPPHGSPGNPVYTPWVDTRDCQRLLLVVRGSSQAASSAGTEFETSMDGVTTDTWWTADYEDNHNYIHQSGGTSYAYSFSFHGQQPAAAPFARVSFGHGDATPETVEKAWIYCVR